MGAYGLRPVAEIQFADYIYPALDQIVTEAARLRYRTAGEWSVPMTIRSPYGGGIFGGQTHSQSPEALFAHVAGVKTVIPSTPYDAKGLLIAAIEDNDPVVFFEPKRIYNGPFDGFFDRPADALGQASGVRGARGLLHASRSARPRSCARARRDRPRLRHDGPRRRWPRSAERGIDAEVIDLRTLVPLDIETIEQSVKKTGRCVVVHEATRTSGFGAELAALVQERCFYHLEAPVQRVDRLRHALSALARMGLFPRAGADRHGARESAGG